MWRISEKIGEKYAQTEPYQQQSRMYALYADKYSFVVVHVFVL